MTKILTAAEAAKATATPKQLFSRLFETEQYRAMERGARYIDLRWVGLESSNQVVLMYMCIKKDPTILEDLRSLGYKVETTSKKILRTLHWKISW